MKSFLGIDFETFYGKGYTLKSMTTEEYVRDPRFRAHGAAITENRQPAFWVTHNELPAYFRSVDWRNTIALAHHAQFDGLILSHHYGCHPAMWTDTQSMCKMLGMRASLKAMIEYCNEEGANIKPKGNDLALSKDIRILPPNIEEPIGRYSCDDITSTVQCFDWLKDRIPFTEWEFMDLVIKMFTRPLMHINTGPLVDRINEIEGVKRELCMLADLPMSLLMSNQQLTAHLAALIGAENVPKSLAKTNPELRDLLEHEDPRVSLAVAARLGVKGTMEQTRAERLIEMAGRGRACVYLNVSGAKTHRLSGGDGMNFQNPMKGSPIRTCLEAPNETLRMAVADSSQIEARVLATLAGQWDLVEKFRNGVDVYSQEAEKVYPGEWQGHEKHPRRGVGKILILGLGFGMSAVGKYGDGGLKASLARGMLGSPPMFITADEAQRWVDIYRNGVRRICGLWWDHAPRWIECMAEGREMEYGPLKIRDSCIELPGGLLLRYPALQRLEDESWTYQGIYGDRVLLYGSKLIENVVQALARVIVMDQTRIIARNFPVVMSTHDEATALVSADRADQSLEFMLETMRTSPVWMPRLPLGAEGKYAMEYPK